MFEFESQPPTSYGFKLTWFENNIYVISFRSNTVRVFSGEAPFDETPNSIFIMGMTHPNDIVASPVNRSIFISEAFSNRFWKIQMSDRSVSQHGVENGMAWTMCVTAAEEMILVVEREFEINCELDEGYDDDDDSVMEDDEDDDEEDDQYEFEDYDDSDDCDPEYFFHLYIYNIVDVTLLKMIKVTRRVEQINHVVQLSSRNFLITHLNWSIPNVSLVSELSSDGKQFLRTFDFRKFKSIPTPPCYLHYLAITRDEQVFVVDRLGKRVFLFNKKLDDYQILEFNNRELVSRQRSNMNMTYVEHKKQLIVAGEKGSKLMVYVLHLSPCDVNNAALEES